MKKSFVLLILTGMIATVNAEVIQNPDSNTLWQENGKNIKTSPKLAYKNFIWNAEKIKITPHEKQGFFLEGNGVTGVYLPSSTQYKWLCLDLASVNRIGNGYHALNMVAAPKLSGYGPVSRIPRGKYYLSVEGTPGLTEKASGRYMRMTISNAKLHVNSVSMIKTPPCLPEVTPANVKKGDTVTIHCKTVQKAQYVEFKFYQTYTMPNLKPAKDIKRCEAKEVPGSNGTEWTYTFSYNGFAGAARGRDKNGFKKGEVLLQIILETEEEVTDNFFFLPNTFQ